jgi:predicted ATPase
LLQEQADGNPFCLTEVLKTLAQSRAIAFAPDLGLWRWSLDAVRAGGINANVVDFVVAKLRRLPAESQTALQLAACIGNAFDLRTLSIIDERLPDGVARSLMPALQQHLIAPIKGDYKLVGITSGKEPAQADTVAVNPVYRFHHDRIQQAAYALIDEDRRQPVHLSIGRLVQTHADSEEREERLIEIVAHLNNGRRLITDPAEWIGLARLNLAAGVQAQRSSAYEAAINYLRRSQELLPPDSWTLEYRLTMDLAMEFQQCAYLTTRYDEAESGFRRSWRTPAPRSRRPRSLRCERGNTRRPVGWRNRSTPRSWVCRFWECASRPIRIAARSPERRPWSSAIWRAGA